MFDRWMQVARADEGLVRRGRYVNATVLLDRIEDSFLITIRDGAVESIEPKPAVTPTWTFTLRSPSAEWAAFWQPSPAPGSHDLLALLRRRVMVVEGDIYPFMINLRYFKDLLQIPRREGVLS